MIFSGFCMNILMRIFVISSPHISRPDI